MVESQLACRDIHDQSVLDAMGRVPREQFVPDDERPLAYDDRALPIGYDQTISQPYTVAFMLQSLRLNGTETMLEIGTGSGYCAAVASLIVPQVHTVERIAPLAAAAAERLKTLGYHNVQVHIDDGTLGLPEHAPFDAVIVTAGAESLPDAYREQLAEGGRIVIPIGDQPRSQTMYRYTRSNDQWHIDELGSFAFVPLIGSHGGHEPDST